MDVAEHYRRVGASNVTRFDPSQHKLYTQLAVFANA
jgi:hypothetical protein